MNDPIASFDLDAYAARYTGRGKITRLRFIADRSPQLAPDALRLAIIEALKGRDTSLYRELQLQADALSASDRAAASSQSRRNQQQQQQQQAQQSQSDQPPRQQQQQQQHEQSQGKVFEVDSAWIRENDLWASKELDKLRHELEDNKQQANKEVIRTGHQDLGDFFERRGRLAQARGEYIKTRDYCMHAAHNLQMCANVIRVSVEAGDYAHVESHYLMAENIPDVDKQSPELAKMRACAGLALLVRGNYAHAATRFLAVNADAHEDKVASLGEAFGDVLSLEDLAAYGALTALATLSRPQLRKQVLERAEFRTLLELVPDVRELVVDFYHTRFTRCLAVMARLRAELALDLYLGRDGHVDALFRLIRRKAIVQYVAPFVTADLRRMRDVFRTDRAELEQELLGLIEAGVIDARIDTVADALLRRKPAARASSVVDAVRQAQDAFDDVEAMLLRMTLLKSHADVDHASGGVMGVGPSSGGGGSRGAGGSGMLPLGLGPRGASISSVVDAGFDAMMRP